MENFEYDLIVIGSGPGGYVAAIRASQLGLKTAVIEKDKPGGVCLNVGCIPSKSLIHQAEIFNSIKDLASMGVAADKSQFDYSKVFKKSRKAAETLSKGVLFLLNKNKVDYIEGEARISGPREVTVGDRKIRAGNILIATGSRPREIPGFKIDEESVLSSTGALMQETLPSSILILGAGAIGVEFAHIMNSFGVKVYLVEVMDHILPLEDEEVAETLNRLFRRRGIKCMVNTKALFMERTEKGVKVVLQDNKGKTEEIEAEKILLSVGRAPNWENIGLEGLGIETERGFIPVGDYYQTKVPGIYAIGDVINTPMLAHVASKEGEIAVEYMAGHNPSVRVDSNTIPGAVYCEPQVGSFGYTEKRAREEGLEFDKAVFNYRAVGKAVAVEQIDGLVKVVFNPKSREILGAHIIGAQATELIHEILLAKTAELLPQDIATMIHAHPTLSEAVMESMRAAEGWAIHM